MKIFFALLVVIFLALSGYHFTFRGVKMPLFSRKLYFTGTEFLLLGILLGPDFLDLLDKHTVDGLEPVKALILGWIGLLFGFQFEIAKLKRFPFFYFKATLLEGATTFFVVFLFVMLSLPVFLHLTFNQIMVISLTLSAAAACSAQTGIALFAKDVSLSKNKPAVRLLRYMTSIDCAIALFAFCLAYLFKTSVYWETLHFSKLLALPLAIFAAPLGLLLIYIFFLSQKLDDSELSLIIIGMTLLTSATAMLHNFSPLLNNFFFGCVLVNILKGKERIFNILSSIEKPLYLLLLVFIGATLNTFSLWILLFSVGYCLFRMAGKLSGGALISKVIPQFSGKPRQIGFGLLEQGGLPVAMIFDFQHGFSSYPVDVVSAIALLGILLNDILSPNFIGLLLKEEENE